MRKKKNSVKIHLLTKLMLIILVPMFCMVTYASVSIGNTGRNTASKLIREELAGMMYALEGSLKGLMVSGEENTDFTRMAEYMASFKENTGVDVAVLSGTSVLASSIDSMEIPGDVADMVLSGETYYNPSFKMGAAGSDYYTYIMPVFNHGEAAPVGMALVAIPVSEVDGIFAADVTNSMILMSVITVAFCVIAAVVLIKIIRAILAMLTSLERVAQGHLDEKVGENLLRRNDEIGRLAGTVNAVTESLSQIVRKIEQSCSEITEFTERFANNFDIIGQSVMDINKAGNEIAKGAAQQASDTKHVSGKISDMNGAIGKTTEGIRKLEDSAASMYRNNEAANSTLNELMAMSRQACISMDKVQKQTGLTNESVQEIRIAADLITEIAGRTNLLSLNASIEAARAGAAGRGFSVVAGEIRELAEQSESSADKIRKIVRNLIQNSDSSVETMCQVISDTEKQGQWLKETKEVFDALNHEVRQVVINIDSISGEIGNITEYKDAVSESIAGLSEIAQGNAAGAAETSVTIEQLEHLVDESRKAIQKLTGLSAGLMENSRQFTL